MALGRLGDIATAPGEGQFGFTCWLCDVCDKPFLVGVSQVFIFQFIFIELSGKGTSIKSSATLKYIKNCQYEQKVLANLSAILT